jgi:hypothetical protein
MITPLLILDSREKWRPTAVETILEVGATINGYPVEFETLPALGGKIDFPKGMTHPKDAPLVGYHRMVGAGGLFWHQFWTWWLYNPKKYVGVGEHEGDWEMIQFACTDAEGWHPVLATCSQHSAGEKREYWRVEIGQWGDAHDKPRFFVARDSHANYFGVHSDVTDQADGEGPLLDPEWREFGGWADWKGKWGNSDNSPGPLPTRRAWQAPHAWHAQARG